MPALLGTLVLLSWLLTLALCRAAARGDEGVEE